jgi:hypothetical protein
VHERCRQDDGDLAGQPDQLGHPGQASREFGGGGRHTEIDELAGGLLALARAPHLLDRQQPRGRGDMQSSQRLRW